MRDERGRPLIFGEVLYDVFHDGAAVLGGAPFNVAWNLRGFGLDPLFISRVGDDGRGRGVLESMAAWGLDTDGVQVDPERATGVVEVSLEGGQPSFNIHPGRAWDFIESGASLEAAAGGDFSILYHGTLIARSETSRRTLASLREAVSAPVFVDVNLRPPWWTQQSVHASLDGAAWAKLNHDELFELSRSAGHSTAGAPGAAEWLLGEFGLDGLVVTMGAEGAMMLTRGGDVYRQSPHDVENVVDTVGAGDAFSAVVMLGLAGGWSVELTLARAVAFASDVCGMRGATTRDRGIYEARAAQWGISV